MSAENTPTTGSATAADKAFENQLRPRCFEDFPGQDRLKDNLHIYIEAAKKRGDHLDHILFSGPPGLGKTTLAGIVAQAMGAELRSSSGPALERPADLAGLLTNLKAGDVLFIDEIHRLPMVVEEYLYSAMEDWSIDIVMEQGLYAQSVHLPIQRFTLIGATTREGLLTAPFRARFGIVERLDYYPPDDLHEILRRSARILEVPMDDTGGLMLATHSRGTPRIANRFLARARDVAQVKGDGAITEAIAHSTLAMLGVDENGLIEMDRRILTTLYDHEGGPVGVKTIAVTVGETEDTIENVYEPYLIQQGLLLKTPQGRKLSAKAYAKLGLSQRGQKELF
ncbi:MAG: Holliday junction branch migration DNA helicase RuvB [Planctomycetota bacterium]|jgi:Holliday junction DNA helicase RuvB